MPERLLTYLHENWLVAVSMPFYTVLILLEVLFSSYQHRAYYSLGETLINFWLNIANALLGLLCKVAVLAMLYQVSQFAPMVLPAGPVYWILLFFGVDFFFYWEHRFEHESRILWAVHVTHHSSPEYNLTTGFRSSVFRPFVSCWFWVPLALLGFKPLEILFMDALCQIYGILVHTQYVRRMPAWFEAVFVSPSHHRVHHASNVEYLDRNMGMTLIVWDRLFGTFQRELAQVPVRFGITTPPAHPHHPLKIIFHEWVKLGKDLSIRGIRFSDKLRYIFSPPGWSHDGSTQTADQMRARLPDPK